MAMMEPVTPIVRWNVACHQTHIGLGTDHSLHAFAQMQKQQKYKTRTALHQRQATDQ